MKTLPVAFKNLSERLLVTVDQFFQVCHSYCRCLAAPFAPDLEVGPHLFAVTHDAKLVITAGHWDFSVRVFTAKAKLLQRLTYHNGKDQITLIFWRFMSSNVFSTRNIFSRLGMLKQYFKTIVQT